jgi:hypothetical protein
MHTKTHIHAHNNVFKGFTTRLMEDLIIMYVGRHIALRVANSRLGESIYMKNLIVVEVTEVLVY